MSTDQQLTVQRRCPSMSDLGVISLSLMAECIGIDSENDLFRILPPCFKTKIEHTVFNRRKRRLMSYQNAIRMKLATSSRSKICKEELYSMPVKGYCASQKMYYYGYKLHVVCSLKGIFQAIDLTPANVHDIHYLNDIKYQPSDWTLLVDKRYFSSDIQLNLFEALNIRLDTPKRTNQKEYKPQFSLYRKSRKRIEILFSQMCDQFVDRRNYAKSFDGFKTRISTKISII